MDGCIPDVGRRTIRSAGRSRIRIPKSILSRIPHVEKPTGLEENRDSADGSLDGIGRSQAPASVQYAQGAWLQAQPKEQRSLMEGLGAISFGRQALFFSGARARQHPYPSI
jgi:hypothetical protein